MYKSGVIILFIFRKKKIASLMHHICNRNQTVLTFYFSIFSPWETDYESYISVFLG